MRLCIERTGPFCYDCAEFPCDRLRHLDERYRTRYGMSEIENLEYIRDHRLEQFLEHERGRWVSDQGVLCVHDRRYYPPGHREAVRFITGERLPKPRDAFPMRTEFGWIEVGGRRYDHDIVIHTDGSVSRRRKKLSKGLKGAYGHTPLSEAELAFLRDERTDVVYVGTGQYGSLPLTPGAEEILSSRPSVVMPTAEILPLLEGEKRPHAAILHVTC